MEPSRDFAFNIRTDTARIRQHILSCAIISLLVVVTNLYEDFHRYIVLDPSRCTFRIVVRLRYHSAPWSFDRNLDGCHGRVASTPTTTTGRQTASFRWRSWVSTQAVGKWSMNMAVTGSPLGVSYSASDGMHPPCFLWFSEQLQINESPTIMGGQRHNFICFSMEIMQWHCGIV